MTLCVLGNLERRGDPYLHTYVEWVIAQDILHGTQEIIVMWVKYVFRTIHFIISMYLLYVHVCIYVWRLLLLTTFYMPHMYNCTHTHVYVQETITDIEYSRIENVYKNVHFFCVLNLYLHDLMFANWEHAQYLNT